MISGWNARHAYVYHRTYNPKIYVLTVDAYVYNQIFS